MVQSHLAASDSTLSTMGIAPQTINTPTNVNTGAIDMSGWNGVEFTIYYGAMTGAAALDAYVDSSPNANMTGAANITNAAIAQVAAANATNMKIVDVWRPTNRYVRLTLVPTTNATIVAVGVRRYGRNGLLAPTQTAIEVVKVAQN